MSKFHGPISQSTAQKMFWYAKVKVDLHCHWCITIIYFTLKDTSVFILDLLTVIWRVFCKYFWNWWYKSYVIMQITPNFCLQWISKECWLHWHKSVTKFSILRVAPNFFLFYLSLTEIQQFWRKENETISILNIKLYPRVLLVLQWAVVGQRAKKLWTWGRP